MTICCGAGTSVDEVSAALAEHGQWVAVPDGGTVGGALAVGHSGLRRLGWGPVRDTVLQARYVSAAGDVVKAGGPTVKNVSGFDLCRLLVGSRGTLGFLGDVILRTRPLPLGEQWFTSDARSVGTARRAVPADVGAVGRPHDLGAARRTRRRHRRPGRSSARWPPPTAHPPMPAHRWSMPPSELVVACRAVRAVRRRDRRRRRPSQPRRRRRRTVDPAVRGTARPDQARVRPDRAAQSGPRRARRRVNVALRAYVDRPGRRPRRGGAGGIGRCAVWRLDEPELLRAGMNAIFRAGDGRAAGERAERPGGGVARTCRVAGTTVEWRCLVQYVTTSCESRG